VAPRTPKPLAPKPLGRPRARVGGIDTRQKLVLAAVKEFGQGGFAGTDTNRIARRAGFAPQTFYRWFRDKTEIFIAVYRLWEEDEREMIDGLLAANAKPAEIVDAAIAHHRDYLVFRRSLRALSVEDPDIRAARAESRKRQIERLKGWMKPSRKTPSEIAATLLQMERLADAIAEGELADLDLDEKAARDVLVDLQLGLRR
jgi:AcrR family transcriptional regulator